MSAQPKHPIFTRGGARYDRPEMRPNLVPFVIKIISESKKRLPYGMKRIQAVVRCLGVTKTVHLDVPQDFSI